MLWISVASGIVLMGILLLGFLFRNVGTCRDFNQAKLQIGSNILDVAVATTSAEKTRGLAGCQAIPRNAGMYFPGQEKGRPVYWMKGMVIPIDIVWIADGKVVQVTANVPPAPATKDIELPRYSPDTPIDSVLEVGAGKAQEYGLAPGVIISQLKVS